MIYDLYSHHHIERSITGSKKWEQIWSTWVHSLTWKVKWQLGEEEEVGDNVKAVAEEFRCTSVWLWMHHLWPNKFFYLDINFCYFHTWRQHKKYSKAQLLHSLALVLQMVWKSSKKYDVHIQYSFLCLYFQIYLFWVISYKF